MEQSGSGTVCCRLKVVIKFRFCAEILANSQNGVDVGGEAMKYKKALPRLLYTYFVTYNETFGAPSIAKFAKSIGATVAELEGFRTHGEFDRAYRECNEIRRDYLIDNALGKRFDSSLVKYLLDLDLKTEGTGSEGLEVTLRVIEDKSDT